MKKIALFIFLGSCLLTLPSCKKFIDKQKQNYLLDIMTSGRWYIDKYAENGVDNTYLFSGYEFQFYKDEKVDALYSSTVTGGIWKGDLSTLTFTSRFSTTNDPLKRLDQVWKVTDSYTDAVFGEVATSSGIVSILLRKK